MKYFAIILLFSLVIVGGCSKDSTTTGPGTTTSTSYFPLATGNWWQYKTSDSTATRTVVGTTAYNSKSYYIVYDASTGDSLRFRQEGTKYYTLVPDATLTGLQEVQYMDETLNATWSYTLSVFGITTTATFTITEVGLTKIVNGKTYTNVIHMHSVQSFGGSTSISELYFAKGIGEIEDIEDTPPVSAESLLSYHIN